MSGTPVTPIGTNGQEPTDGLSHALASILETYGDKVSINQKRKGLLKIGNFPGLGTSYETVQTQGGLETYCTDNVITHISSSDATDTQSVIVEGHTISNGLLSFSTQTLTLAGQTKTALATPLARATRLIANGTTDYAGTVYVYEDDTVSGGVPSTAAKIHVQTGIRNKSWKGSTSLSANDYWLITDFYCFVNKKTQATVDFILESREVAATNKVFTPLVPANGSAGAPATFLRFDPPVIVPKNSDIRVVAAASTTAVEVTSYVNGYLATVIG